jgi:glycyl-tRNA synthetase beta chain
MRKAHVIVDQNERKELIVQKAKEVATKIGATPYYTDDLLEEVTFITEYPVPALCEFDPRYLDIPEEVTVTVMAVHQRYFALYKNGKLTNNFITMTNYLGDDFENIKAGNVRVIKARLDDAVFFFNEDTKKPLIDYVESLKGVTFQKGMGTMFDKTNRLIALSKSIAEDLNVNSKDVERTAQLCKADLTTNLVFEFTELQGFIGADYARVSGENDKVVQGIKEHYFPLNAESETAKGVEGQIVGIADKIDTVCAVFVAGKKPTGSSDPLGVRRSALGVIRTILDGQLKLDINKYIKETLTLLPVQRDCAEEIEEFFVQRMIIFLAEKYSKTVLEACSAKNPLSDITDYVKRVEIVQNLDSAQLVENANRVIRILKETSNEPVNEAYFKEPIEKTLYNEIKSVKETSDYTSYLKQLENLNSAVSKFFDDVLVMDKDENVKKNRISLLTLLKAKYDFLTDFSKI